jgi:hypothetical protein
VYKEGREGHQRVSIVLLKNEKVKRKKRHKQRRFELPAKPPVNMEAATVLHQLPLIGRHCFPFFL